MAKQQLSFGKMQRIEGDEGWCAECMKSTMFTAIVSELREDGIYDWGKVVGCAECKVWVWTDLTGKVYYTKIEESK